MRRVESYTYLSSQDHLTLVWKGVPSDYLTTDQANSNAYYCKVGSDCGPDLLSEFAAVTVKTSTEITAQPTSLTTVCEGDDCISTS